MFDLEDYMAPCPAPVESPSAPAPDSTPALPPEEFAAAKKPRAPRKPRAPKLAEEENPFAVDLDLPAFIRPTLIARAQGRVKDVSPCPGSSLDFVVQGDPSAGDMYADYTVHHGRRWTCSCQAHQGGKFRGICSHIVACMIWDRYPRWQLASAPAPAPAQSPNPPAHLPDLATLSHTPPASNLVQWENQMRLDTDTDPQNENPPADPLPLDWSPNPFTSDPSTNAENCPDALALDLANLSRPLDLESAEIDPCEWESAYSTREEECESAGVSVAEEWRLDLESAFCDDPESWGALPPAVPPALASFLAKLRSVAQGAGEVLDIAPLDLLRPDMGTSPLQEFPGAPILPADLPEVQNDSPSPTTPDPNFLDPLADPLANLTLPPWCKSLRPHQTKAIRDVYSAFASGKRNVILEAPTGAGKSLLGHLIAQAIGARSLYVCTTKTLQEQYLADFTHARVIKGRRNYPTQLKPFPDWTCEDCDFKKERGCSHCGETWEDRRNCAYQRAKRAAEMANESVLNTAYFLGSLNSPAAKFDNREGYLGHDPALTPSAGFRRRGLAVFDEADELESCLMGAVELSISRRTLDELSLDAPDPDYSRWPDRLRWLGEDVSPKVEEMIRECTAAEDDRGIKKWARLFDQVQSVLADAKELCQGQDFRETWIYDLDAQTGAAVFKPIRVAKYGRPLLFSHSQYNLIMSATIVAPEQFASDLGLDWSDTQFIAVPSTFPKERRPIFLRPVANVTRADMHIARPKLAKEIATICRERAGDPILVHTVSYDLTSYLHNILADQSPDLAPRLISYTNAGEKAGAIARFLDSQNGIILAPSMDRGENLKDDRCRVVIVAKTPWLNKGDRQVKRRLFQPTPRDGQMWFQCSALRTVIQMTGRGMRSETDWCRTYILDEQFMNLYQKSRHLLPKWWSEAVVTSSRDPLVALGL